MTASKAPGIPASSVWALGLTQIIGYGTLYYGFGTLAPDIGRAFGWPPEWLFGALSVALLSGGLLAPLAGHLADRLGAARTMTLGSLAASLLLALASLAGSGLAFAAALVGMEIASTLVLYATAFAALVQAGGQGAQRSITHLTLIAGFASTLFWPFTALLLTMMDWRAVYLVFAGLNLLVCAPIHYWLSRRRAVSGAPPAQVSPAAEAGILVGRERTIAFVLMLLGFAVEGFILSGILLQIMPILTGLELGASALLVTSLFGPAQVLSRLVNMLLGRNLSQTTLAVIAALLLPLGVAMLALTAPSVAGAFAFALLFGLGSGLTSIVSGSLPLQLMGRERYGARLGWMSSARQVASAVAPFIFAVLAGAISTPLALWFVALMGALSTLAFGTIWWRHARSIGLSTPAASEA